MCSENVCVASEVSGKDPVSTHVNECSMVVSNASRGVVRIHFLPHRVRSISATGLIEKIIIERSVYKEGLVET